jgi:hypothetical protein
VADAGSVQISEDRQADQGACPRVGPKPRSVRVAKPAWQVTRSNSARPSPHPAGGEDHSVHELQRGAIARESLHRERNRGEVPLTGMSFRLQPASG